MLASPYDEHDLQRETMTNLQKKSPKANTLADGLIKGTSSMVDEIESKSVHKDEEGH